jgi:hypothetical protein
VQKLCRSCREGLTAEEVRRPWVPLNAGYYPGSGVLLTIQGNPPRHDGADPEYMTVAGIEGYVWQMTAWLEWGARSTGMACRTWRRSAGNLQRPIRPDGRRRSGLRANEEVWGRLTQTPGGNRH